MHLIQQIQVIIVKFYCFSRKNSTYGIETGFNALMYSVSAYPSKAFTSYYSMLSTASVDRVEINIGDGSVIKY